MIRTEHKKLLLNRYEPILDNINVHIGHASSSSDSLVLPDRVDSQ